MRLEVLRTFDEVDRTALLTLWVAAWTAGMPAIDFAARMPWFAGHLEALLAGGALLVVAHEDGPPAGFLTVHPGTGEIDQLAVDPVRQGSGVARALIAEAKRLRPGGLHLRVNTANARAVALYESAGFVRTGEEVNLRSGLPVWTMQWPGRDPAS